VEASKFVHTSPQVDFFVFPEKKSIRGLKDELLSMERLSLVLHPFMYHFDFSTFIDFATYLDIHYIKVRI
jgi:hypothetical protein